MIRVRSKKPNLEDAIRLATLAHRGQKDKQGQPYILHPLRVMLAVTSLNDRLAGILHDVVEDTKVTLADLTRLGYPKVVVRAVDHLSKRDGETYEDFIARVIQDPIAVRVKQADIADNMGRPRRAKLTRKDKARLIRYRKALIIINKSKYLRK